MFSRWHLGYCSDKFLPTSRGFDEFYGFLSGGQDHFVHSQKGKHKYENVFIY